MIPAPKEFFEILQLGEQEIPVLLRKSRTAKRLSLRFAHTKDQLLLTVPPGISQRAARKFIHQSHDWIISKAQRPVKREAFTDGVQVPILGKPYVFRYHEGKRAHVWVEGQEVSFRGPEERHQFITEKWIRQLAQSYLEECSQDYAAMIGAQLNQVRVRDTKSRWGSCSGEGNISYSWRLAFASLEVAHYVCVHETAHLKEMNHGPDFWKIVEQLCPDYKIHRTWLKKNGSQLFRFGS
ncbi:MAG: M48 family metallopeptidase [Alphaproteobacteria bacterium]|jgi:predicted metal-dependent hydrolase|nr:M48 family metallopeptidase [Alphaproteobacteria bacterium]MBT5389378.1 M48 family metallopeptidase [Alphaproteobacteria bacterium]MBT5540553.1 M48 family metallopeptidase [Alphaproteobacteria bacterium]MBT5653899.1 M48 family metallopeptidase [Alphaproteobacteria bacterium]